MLQYQKKEACHNSRLKYVVMNNGLYSEVNFAHFGHWFTNSEVDPCQTAAVQMVDGSDLRAHADLQEWPISGSGDMCWLTAVPKLASWQLCCWGLSVLAGHRFDPDPTSLTSWQDFCSEQQCWHRHTNIHTYRRQTHTHTHAWQTGKYFITLCNGRASGYCTLLEQQEYCEALQVKHTAMDIFFWAA